LHLRDNLNREKTMLREYVHLTSLVGSRHGMPSQGAAERGATAVEYALMIALIALVIFVGVTALGATLNGIFTSAGNQVTS
jgi:pilus assembly protein Flp/PilA